MLRNNSDMPKTLKNKMVSGNPRPYSTYLQNILSFQNFQKYIFQNFLGPFLSPGDFCPPFSNSLSHAPYPHIFPPFDLFLHSLLQGIHLLMIGTHLLLTGVTNLRPVALTWPIFFTTPSTSPPPSPLHHEAVEPNFHRHPYAQGLTFHQ